jgi:pimeloyl-ACP methyl ester carboxylesterase
MTDYRNTLGYKIAHLVESIEASIYGLKDVTVNVKGLEIAVYQSKRIDPNKPTIVMLHGFSADKKVWLRFAKHFVNDFNVIIPDLAGHGKTPYSVNNSHSISAQAIRVIELLAVYGINQFHLLGNSMGGFITAHSSIYFAENILSSCLVDPAGIIPLSLSKMDRLVIAGKNPFLIKTKQNFYDFYAMTMAKPPYIPKFILDCFALEYQSKYDRLESIFSEFLSEDGLLDKELTKVNCPTLILWGASDELLHVDNAKLWHENIKDSELTVWPGVGHMPMMEIAKTSANRYRLFLSDNGFC